MSDKDKATTSPSHVGYHKEMVPGTAQQERDSSRMCMALAFGSGDPDIYSALMELSRSHDLMALELDAIDREAESSARVRRKPD